MGRIRLLGGVLVAVAAVSGASAATAPGATSVGSSLAATPNAFQNINTTVIQTAQPTGTTYPLAAPSSGVIVSIQQKVGSTGADPGRNGYRILTPAGGTNYTARRLERVRDFTPPVNQPVGPTMYVTVPADSLGRPQGVPIAAGERLAFVQAGGTAGQTLQIYQFPAGPTPAVTLTNSVHDSGTANYNNVFPQYEILLQYRIEPDADGDMYGDESQDRCPADPSGNCCPADPTQPCVQVQEVPGPVQEVPGPVQEVPAAYPTFGDDTLTIVRLATPRADKHGKLAVEVANGNSFPISGDLTVRTHKRYDVTISAGKPVTVGFGHLSIQPGASQNLRMKLPPELASALKKAGKLRLDLSAIVRDPAGIERMLKSRATLRSKRA